MTIKVTSLFQRFLHVSRVRNTFKAALITSASLIGSMAMSLHASAQAVTAPTTPVPVPYSPSLSDMMNIGVQPRHIKLWLGGKQQNWAYATYELSELRNAFARVGRTSPVYRNMDLAALLTTFTQPPMEALDMAIKNHDAKAFVAAYGQLTMACNACHQGLQHENIVIKVPDANAYPDQDFRPRQASK